MAVFQFSRDFKNILKCYIKKYTVFFSSIARLFAFLRLKYVRE